MKNYRLLFHVLPLETLLLDFPILFFYSIQLHISTSQNVFEMKHTVCVFLVNREHSRHNCLVIPKGLIPGVF